MKICLWSARHASQCIQEKDADLSVLMPLFREDSSHLNSQQTQVIAFDQSLFATVKQVQSYWKELYEQDFVVMMGALHIEMVAYKTLGNSLFIQCMSLFYHICQKNGINSKNLKS